MSSESKETMDDDGSRSSSEVLLREEIIADVYGTSAVSSFERAEEMLKQARTQLEEALALIPKEEKEAYTEASQKVPHLVEIESKPNAFLRFTNYDPWAAAKLLVLHWQHRKDIFGDRFLLPMTQTGEGALSPEDVQVLNDGFVVLLPSDSKGRAVTLHDRSRLTDSKLFYDEAMLRCLFYILSVAAENSQTQLNGFVMLSIHSDKTSPKSFGIAYNKLQQKGVDLLQSGAFPIRFKAAHLVVLKKRGLLETIVPTTLKVLEQWNFLKQRTVVHFGSTEKELLEDLVKYGFGQDGLPLCMGGSWDYANFADWQARRKDLEQKDKYLSAMAGNVSSVPVEELLKAAESAQEEEIKKRKRAMDAHYARRKRERKKIENEVMKEQKERLQRQNTDLRKTNEKLTKLLEQAQYEVDRYEASVASGTVPHVAGVSNPTYSASNVTAAASSLVAPSAEASFPSLGIPVQSLGFNTTAQASLTNLSVTQERIRQLRAQDPALIEALRQQLLLEEQDRIVQAALLAQRQQQAINLSLSTLSPEQLQLFTLSQMRPPPPQSPPSQPLLPQPSQQSSFLSALFGRTFTGQPEEREHSS